jgi:hypothetical protein
MALRCFAKGDGAEEGKLSFDGTSPEYQCVTARGKFDCPGIDFAARLAGLGRNHGRRVLDRMGFQRLPEPGIEVRLERRLCSRRPDEDYDLAFRRRLGGNKFNWVVRGRLGQVLLSSPYYTHGACDTPIMWKPAPTCP